MPTTTVGMLILINVIVYLLDGFSGYRLTQFGAARVGTLWTPWFWWQFLTYGFLHAPQLQHVLFNMLILFFFGRDVEALYGRAEFTRLYLLMIVVGGVVWAAANRLQGVVDGSQLIGASGAVVGIFVLFCLHYPHRTVLLFFVLPVPAWLAGLLLVVPDFLYAIQRADTNIAYSVHLTGVAVAILYYQSGWNIGKMLGVRGAGGFWQRAADWFRRRPSLKVHDPRYGDDPPEDRNKEAEDENEEKFNREVDRILEKIHQEGEESLTWRERRIMREASRRYRQRQGPR